MKIDCPPQPTHPRDVADAQLELERTCQARLDFDDELIRRMEEGPMIEASDVDRDQMRENAVRIAAGQGGRR